MKLRGFEAALHLNYISSQYTKVFRTIEECIYSKEINELTTHLAN